MSGFDLAGWLDRRMSALGIGPTEVASRSGVLTPQHVSKLRSGTNKGQDFDTLTALARAFGMTRAQLVAAVDGEAVPKAAPGAENAIRKDPHLTADEAEAVLVVYWSYARRGRARRAP